MESVRKRVNVIVILSDDQGAWSLDNPEIDTPHLDRLAYSGCRFDNFFCASPVCSPARATLLTGRLPSQHGVHDWILAGNVAGEETVAGGAPGPADGAVAITTVRPIRYLSNETAYTDVLSRQGYVCGLSGKWHLGDSVTPQHGHSFWRVHARGSGGYFNPPMVVDGSLAQARGYVTDIITDNALEFLSSQSRGTPFYLGVHYTAPHAPWGREHHPDDIFSRYYDNCEFATFPDEPAHPWQSSIYSPRGDEGKRREFLSGYCAAITAMDAGIGRILDFLNTEDLTRETLVLFLSDNGMNMGHHGIYGKGNGTFPLNMYDTSVRVPAIASHPGSVPGSRHCDALVSQYDVFPTLLDYVGIVSTSDSRSPGRSFAGLLRSEESGGHEMVVSAPVFDEYGPVRMIRTDDWKLITRNPYGPHELFHLSEDLGEVDNLYGDAAYAARSRELAAELRGWFGRHVDSRVDGMSLPVSGLGQIAALTADSDGTVSAPDDAFVQGAAQRVTRLAIDPAAEIGNAVLRETVVGNLLADFGRRLHLPTGLAVQAAEARQHAHLYNATTGMATTGGEPAILSSVDADLPGLTPADSVSYAPPGGLPELRELWLQELLEKNPALDPNAISVPVVVPGLTHGLLTAADLFLEGGDRVIVPNLYWENYRLIFSVRRGAAIVTYPLVTPDGSLNVDGLDSLIRAQPREGKIALLLNFPNNPTGFSPNNREVQELVSMINHHASAGRRVVVICDDAYFGLLYESDLYEQSLAAPLASQDENLLVVKIDGSTKEDMAWGLRVGFITFASSGLKREHFSVLEEKCIGNIRSTVSNTSRLSQSLLIRAMKSDAYAGDKVAIRTILGRRYRAVKTILSDRSGEAGIHVLPFNSGYFVTLDLGLLNANQFRRRLLQTHGIGTVAVGPHHLRVAFSSVDDDNLADLFDRLFDSAVRLQPPADR